MSSNPPTEGMFFVDQPTGGEPAPAAPLQTPTPLAPAPEPVPASEPAAEGAAGRPDGMRDVPLGTLIFRAGLLAEEQLEDALQEGMREGKRLGEVLLERGWLHERDLGRLLAGQKGLPFVELSGVTPDPTAVPLIPEEKARLQSTLAIAFEKGVPVVAVADPTNDLVMENLRRVLGCEPRLVVAAHGDLQRKIGEAYAPIELATEAPPAAPAAEQRAAQAAPPLAEPAPAPPPASVEAPAPAEAAPPAVEPMTVAQPPVESAQPSAEPPSLVAQPLVQPVAEQLSQPAPAPAPEPQPEPPSVEPAPLVVETPAPVVQPLSTAPPLAPEVAAPPLVPEVAPPPAAEPPAPVAEPAPEVTSIEAAPEPQPLPQPPAADLEQPQAPEVPAADATPAPEPAAAAPPPAEPAAQPSANGSPAEPAETYYVVLRLSEGEQLEIGALGSREEAQGFAQEVVRQIAAAEGESTWPFFAGRFLRPSGIVSVDVVAGASERWMGSSIRARTFGE